MSDSIEFNRKKAAIKDALIVFLAFLGALGIGFQNTTEVMQLFIRGVSLTTGNAWFFGITVGGIASTVVNFCLNIQLLEDFCERRTGRRPFAPRVTDDKGSIDGAKAFRFWLGVLVFIVTGILFGLTAISVGATGGLAIAAIVAGVFVSLVMIPQEMETWLASFDNPVAVEIGKCLYDINQLEVSEESNQQILELIDGAKDIDGLKKKLEKAILKKKLAELKEDLAGQTEKIEFIDRTLLYLENHSIDLDKLITGYSEKINDQHIANALIETRKNIRKKQGDLSEEIVNNPENIRDRVVGLLKDFKKEAENEQPKTEIIAAIEIWWRDLTPGRLTGLIVSLGNVLALNLLFTIGLAGFLSGVVGVAAFPALIIGFVVAFTFGSFTEFYFYHYFLVDFCDRIAYRWQELIESPNWGLGIIMVITNAAVNGTLAYFGVILLEGLLLAAGVAAPPLLILAVVSAIFAGVASLLLGSDFWIKNAKRFFSFGGKKNSVEDNRPETTPLVINEVSQIEIDLSESEVTEAEANKASKVDKMKVDTPEPVWNWVFEPLWKEPQEWHAHPSQMLQPEIALQI